MKNKTVKKILSALLVAVFGYIVINLTYLVDFIFQTFLDDVVRIFFKAEVNLVWHWYPIAKDLLFLLIVVLVSRSVFQSKMKTLYKNIFLTLPLSVIYTTINIFFFRWPIVVYLAEAYFFFGFLYVFKRLKLSWLYFYTLYFFSLLILILNMMRWQI
ncbi:hypothetical protein M1328_05360 [Patescibacteria group bacterium]|nr:hypothetical protein [Patescibacteria group bacterium]